MGNICCGHDEAHKHGAWYGPKDDDDAEAEHRNRSSFLDDDGQYDANATNREQLILLHENIKGGGSRRRNFRTTRSKRTRIRCTPIDPSSSFSYETLSVPKSPVDTDFLVNALAGNFVFDSIDEKAKLQFVNVMQPQEFNQGDWVMRQGDVGDYFYIVKNGEVAFHVTGEDSTANSKAQDPREGCHIPPQVGTGTSGATFGELALLYNTPRAASVRALTPLKLYKIDQLTFRSMMTSHQLKDRANIISLVEKAGVFQNLDRAKLCKLVDAFTVVHFSYSERIVNKGDQGNILYIVMSGGVKVDDIGHGRSKFEDQILEEGGCFGERALITGETRAANITAVAETSLLAISKHGLEEIIGPLEEACKMSSYSKYLRSIPLFQYLEHGEIDRCASELKLEHFEIGDKIDSRGGKLYLIEEGHALTMIQDTGDNGQTKNGGEPTLVKLEKGDYFGDLFGGTYGQEHTNGSTPQAETDNMNENLIFVETNMKCLTLLNSDVERIIGGNLRRLSVLNVDPAAEEENKSRISRLKNKWSRRASFDTIKRKKLNTHRDMNLGKLKKHRILGFGSFGKVWLVTPKSNKKDNPTCYALKMISKRQALELKSVSSILREKNVMESTEHPFLVHMVSSFQDENYLYFVMDLILGGELFELMYADEKKLHNTNSAWKESDFYKSFGDEDDKPIKGLAGLGVRSAVFYGACVIEAFNHLHNRMIVYRDLKPENVMMNQKGYCVVVDMGFSKVVLDKTYTVCGTPEYLAPEVITNMGHNHVADYWSFGCLLYELIVGGTPFFSDNISQLGMFKKIIRARYEFPENVTNLSPHSSNGLDEAVCCWKDIISRLLKPNPVHRLGNRGIDDILDHAWLANIDCSAFLNQSIPAPWIPTIVDPLDTSYSEKKFRDMEEQNEVFTQRLSGKDQEVFRPF